MFKTKNSKSILPSKCAVCGSKKARFMKEQKAKAMSSSLGLKTPLSKIPFYGGVLF